MPLIPPMTDPRRNEIIAELHKDPTYFNELPLSVDKKAIELLMNTEDKGQKIPSDVVEKPKHKGYK
jgi:hypothetical protein